METPLINLPKLNFNLFVFIASMIAVGVGEGYILAYLKWFGIIAGTASLVSLVICLWAYTNYYRKVTKNLNKKNNSL